MHTSTASIAKEPLRLAENEIASFLAATPGVVVADVSAAWCMPCRLLRPILRKLATEFAGQATIVEIDADAADTFIGEHEVDCFPQLLLFVNGRRIGREVGFNGAETARAAIAAALGDDTDAAPSPAETAFRDACARADAAFEKVLEGPSAALEPHIDEITPLMEAFEADLKRELEAERITQQEFADQCRNEYQRLCAPFQDKIEALRQAHRDALAAYEGILDPAVEAFARTAAPATAASSQRARACRPGDPTCAM